MLDTANVSEIMLVKVGYVEHHVQAQKYLNEGTKQKMTSVINFEIWQSYDNKKSILELFLEQEGVTIDDDGVSSCFLMCYFLHSLYMFLIVL